MANKAPKAYDHQKLSMIAAPFWGHLGAILGYLGASWAVLGVSWGALGLDFGALSGSVELNVLR